MNISRRQLLLSAGILGVSPILLNTLTACTSLATTTATAHGNALRRKLGNVEVFPIGLGCQWVPIKESSHIGDVYGSTLTKQQAIDLIHHAIDHGVTLIDTAEAYGPFLSEEIVGEALKGRRDKVVLESKFGWNIDLTTGKNLGGVNSRPEHIKQSVDLMLKRLNTDHIDILYQHRVDPTIPIEDVAEAVQKLMQQGKVLNWGLSEAGVNTIRRAHKALPLTAIQNEYTLWWREPERSVMPICEELGIGLVCWSPMGAGFLTGTINQNSRFDQSAGYDIRPTRPRFSPENLNANMPLVELLRTWAIRKNATPAQITLAWILAQKPWIVPIPGTTKINHLDENIAAANIHFTPSEMQEFNQALNAITIYGDRLPESSARYVGVEAP